MQIDLYSSPTLPSIKLIVILAAREGIPIKVIARITRQTPGTVRRLLEEAVGAGHLLALPSDDWPHLGGLSRALPSRQDIDRGNFDPDVRDAALR